VILLPQSANTWTELRRRVVLQHELAHVQRWDWLTFTLAQCVCAFYWYNPLAWYAARRMRLEREQACDDLVLRRDTLPSDYAGELLQLAAGFTGHSLIDWATVPMARRSALEGRLLAILDKQRNRAGVTRVVILGAVALAAAVIIPVAMLRAATEPSDASANPPNQTTSATTTSPPAANPSAAAKPGQSMTNTRGIAVDKDGVLYAVDYDQYIVYKLLPDGQLGILADNKNFPHMAFPSGLTVDQNKNVYVADPATSAVYKITSEGKVTRLVGMELTAERPFAILADNKPRLNFPTGVAVDVSGNLYVANNYGSSISKIATDGTVTNFAGTPGRRGSTDGVGALALFARPRGVGVGHDGIVYVADEANHNIRKIMPDGTVNTVAGSPNQKPGAQDGAGSEASFFAPHAVAVDAQGNVYVADTNNFTIRKITPPNVVTTFAGKAGAAGYVDGTRETARFNAPRSVAVDNDGNVYVMDSENKDLQSNSAVIRKITPAGVVSTVYAPAPTKEATTNPPATVWNGSFSLKPDGIGNLSLSTQTTVSGTNGATSTLQVTSTVPAGTITPVKLTSLDLKAWGPYPGAPTYAWGNKNRHSPTLKIGGQEFADGITMIAGGPLYLNLAGGTEKFTATIGMDGAGPGTNPPIKAVFKVIGDGKVLYESAPKQRGDAPENISVDTKGVKMLALDVRQLGDYVRGQMRDADWADATFAVSGAQPQAVEARVGELSDGTPLVRGRVQAFPDGIPLARGRYQAFIVQGDVQLVDQGGHATSLKGGQTFAGGGMLKTGPGGQVFLVFSSGETMRVLENCNVKMDPGAVLEVIPTRLGLIEPFIVAGDVQLIDEDGHATPLKRGAPAFTGEGKTIKAGPGSQALIVFSNGATLKMLENCTMKITLFRQEPFDEQAEGTFLRLSRDPSRSNTILEVISGQIQGEAKKLNTTAGSTFIVIGPNGPIKLTDTGSFGFPTDAPAPASGAQPQAVPAPQAEDLPEGTPVQPGLVQAFIVSGDVQLINKDGYAAALYRGETFGEGSTIKAGRGAQALIVFSNGATMKVLENCTVKVTSFQQAPFNKAAEGTFLRLSHDPSRSNTVLDVISGQIQGEFKKPNIESGSTFIVNSPNGPVNFTNATVINAPSASSANQLTTPPWK